MKLKLCLGALAALLAAACDRPTSGPRIGVYEQPQVGLVVIDVQEDFLDSTGRLPTASEQVQPMLAAVNRLIEGAPSSGADVVYVRSEPGAALDPRLGGAHEPVFSKRRSDAFTNADLDTYFRDHSIDHLVLVGAHADASVYTTALGALNRGYKVALVSDAVAAASAARRDRTIEALRQRGVEIFSTEQTLAEWLRRKRYLGSR